jgi:peptide chain release factor 3
MPVCPPSPTRVHDAGQANLNPKHRDRVAFVRICSGTFQKGMKVQHGRLKRSISLAQAQQLFAQERESIEIAYPGDVIGLNNPGTSRGIASLLCARARVI